MTGIPAENTRRCVAGTVVAEGIPPSGQSPHGLARPPAAAAPMSLRYALVHVIAEYARHTGHADLLRERVDGATG